MLDDEISPIKSEKQTFNKGQKLLLEDIDKTVNYVFGISEGIVAMNSDTVTIDFLGVNQFLGLYMNDELNLHGEILSKTAVIWKFELTDVLAKVTSHKKGLLLYNKHVMDIQKNVTQKSNVMKLNNSNKVLLSLRTIASRFGEELDSHDVVRIPAYFTRKVLSNYTNIKATTLTNVLNKLYSKDKILYGRRVILVYI
ncbi:Crp/Fnr family transcriptional regulator [Listeria rocourtiae]|uniref:Crp/Fnr family transcriptional regulator n=1 Tax=Listeria rocourtiae TaxID=647910 RepID=UPI0003E87AFA|nr:Crp/Fnr family transcriptional regulator [Listeria rocourtiae]EUJ48368.1 hypothetical protein PROCOU_05458 [Listeria rocourtiae FSL F6-920]